MSSITLLKSKIHRATVTDADLNYEGSISICADLMEAADIQEYEQVHVLNVNNGNRFVTYAIPSQVASKIQVNGAAAHLVSPGDIVIILSYINISLADLQNERWQPTKIFVDNRNYIKTGNS